jgi:uncharacterized coiled-coil DUF342 family protein
VSTNGHDPNTAKMVDLLGQIAGDLKGVQAAVSMLREEVGEIRERVDTLHEDHLALRAEVVEVKNEVRGLRTEIRADLAHHEERIVHLERGAA